MGGLIEFWKLAAKLKAEPRRGWLQMVPIRKIESVADHSFGVAILSLFEAERRGYNVGHVVKLALVHDLEEAIIGDLTPKDKRRLTRGVILKRKELANLRMLKTLPPVLRRDFEKARKEVRAGRTREARLVKDLDKFEMVLQARDYEASGVKPEKLEDFYRSARIGIKDRTLKEALVQVRTRD